MVEPLVDSATAATRDVPHPLHAYLVELQKSVREVQQKLSGKLDRPGNNFATGNVWVGPTAESWGTQLSNKHSTYKSELGRLDDALTAKLATTPQTCTAEEAQRWNSRLTGG
jgi:hypothetical protein